MGRHAYHNTLREQPTGITSVEDVVDDGATVHKEKVCTSMKQSHSRHNVFSKTDHDRNYIDKNYTPPTNGSSSELPALHMDVRKKLASFHLSTKLSGKTAVVTVATGLGHDDNEAKFYEQFGGQGYEDDNASIASNHSIELENMKKSPELLQMENFMDELGKIGHVKSDGESEDSYDSDESFDDIKDRKKYKTTLDVHKKFMEKARKNNLLADVKSVAAVKIMTHKKKLAKIAQDQTLVRASTAGNKDLSEMTPSKNTTSAVAPSAPGSMMGLASAAKSFMFLSKLSNAGAQGRSAAKSFDSNAGSDYSPQALQRKSTASESILPPPDGSPSITPSAKYSASPSGVAYSSKHNLLHDPALVGRDPNSPLPLFGKAQKPKQIAHRTFSATTLSTLHSKFDTTHSVLSATRDHGAVVKSTAHVGPAMMGSPDQGKPLYHVPELNAVHGKKTFLGHLDRVFNAFTHQTAEPVPKPATPPPPEPMTVETLFGDQLLRANIPAHERVSDRELNTLLNATTGPDNYGPRVKVDHSSAAAIVADLDRALARQKREEAEQKRHYESIAAAHVPSIYGDNTDQNTADYSMATFASRLDQVGTKSAPKDPTFATPPKLDLSRVNGPKSGLKLNSGPDSYSIDVHSLKLPDILSPPSDSYYQQQKQPILCIYSPAPLGGSPGSGPRHSSSPEGGRSFSPEAAAVGRGSPIQLQGTLTTTAGGHSASSPAIMYISSPGLLPATSSSGAQGLSQHAHGRSTASLPIVSSFHNAPAQDNLLHHHYQTQAEYQKSLHPQTRDFLASMKNTNDPDYHTDPRNYRGGAPGSAESLADVNESIYDYEAEYEDSLIPPPGDPGAVHISTDSSRVLLPASAAQQGGDALLSLGYQYQHSTNTYVHKDERNRSKFGQYERSPLGDPYAADFSDRQLQAISDTTVGNAPPVIFIPPGTPAAEPQLKLAAKSVLQKLTNASTIASAAQTTHDPAHVNRKGKNALSPREVVQGTSYAPVRTIMQYPHDVPLSAVHYRGEGLMDSDNESAQSGDDERYDHFNSNKNNNKTGAGAHANISADNSTLHTNNAGADIKQEICDYIEKLAQQSRSNAPQHHHYGASADGSAYPTATSGVNTVDLKKAEKARVKLWDKLNNRYGGDREGEFVRKMEIKEYIFDGIKQDTHIMNDYLAEMEDGWAV